MPFDSPFLVSTRLSLSGPRQARTNEDKVAGWPGWSCHGQILSSVYFLPTYVLLVEGWSCGGPVFLYLPNKSFNVTCLNMNKSLVNDNGSHSGVSLFAESVFRRYVCFHTQAELWRGIGNGWANAHLDLQAHVSFVSTYT